MIKWLLSFIPNIYTVKLGGCYYLENDCGRLIEVKVVGIKNYRTCVIEFRNSVWVLKKNYKLIKLESGQNNDK